MVHKNRKTYNRVEQLTFEREYCIIKILDIRIIGIKFVLEMEILNIISASVPQYD